ncbi:MAG TPA: NAD-dependent epimerase/dehydratase family protein [Phycisphaerales bacterium]|nr:NAD-dependent epimerase/dehydratase family protein [Phycisphaerales bacterium]HIN84280.1 NAD-dependent epimerase/dehydratase family protein [Phycisphaerales bacterium]HIO52196.1 NAD-dependent epimerase/dehydratase family protein [Phycisphaerales bacterium]
MEQSNLGERRQPAVFITGAGGEVGHGLITALSGEHCPDIVATDLRELDTELRKQCASTYLADVCDRDALDRLLAMYQVKEIYHLAAMLSTRAEITPEVAHQVNVNGTVNILHIAAEQGRMYGEPVKVVFPSSIAAYGFGSLSQKIAAGAVSENEHCKPSTMYGCNKLYCEHLGRYYAHSYRQLAKDSVAGKDKNRGVVDFRCVRYPGLISADTVPTGGTSDFVPEMLHAAARGEQYKCFVRPDSRIPFMTMPEAIEATLQLADTERKDLTQIVYNIASFNPSAGEVADLVKVHFPNADITFEPDERRQAIVDSWPSALDCSAAQRDWGFKPTYTLEQAFEQYLVPRITKQHESSV